MRRHFVRLIPFLWFRLGLIHVWRLVPPTVRRRLGRPLLAGTARTRARLPEPQAPLLVCGLLRGTTAFSWVARSHLQLAAEAGIEAHAVDLSEILARDNLAIEPPPPPPREALNGPGTLILHVNPNAFPYVRGFLPDALFDNKYVIASCAWELERIPETWVPHLDLVDELWVPSRFVADAFKNAGVTIPCRVVPPLLRGPDGLGRARDQFRSSADEFLVLMAFSFGSGTTRKNPYAAIAAFRAAFGPCDPARLILKVSDIGSMPEAWARLREECARDPQITLFTDRLDDQGMWGLIDACDVVLSLHRAEGFGMLPAQGMLLGKAVVATGWSGNLDFMRADASVLVPYELVPVADPEGLFDQPDLCWAEPDIAVAAAALRRLYEDRPARQAIGGNAHQAAEAFVSEHRDALVGYFRDLLKN